MRFLVSLTMLCALTGLVFGGALAAPKYDHGVHAGGIAIAAEKHAPDDQHNHSEHCCKTIGTLGCSSSAPALADTGSWQPFRLRQTSRQTTEALALLSISLSPPKRPPRLN